MRKLRLTYKQSLELYRGNTLRISRDGSIYYISTDENGKPIATYWTGTQADVEVISEFHEEEN